ncbi:hypothetical protein QOZ80_4AG0318600 [Eleusine coracana subsp. coracana]|nr:hypothetical protein QOZ80_4AG0318600 [Eleusine coracana subsp. coracana]
MIRIEYSMVSALAVLGSNVIGMDHGRQSGYDDRSDGNSLTFDTKTAELGIMPDLPNGLRHYSINVAVAAGNRLYVIERGSSLGFKDDRDEVCLGGIHCLKLDEDADASVKDRKPSISRKEPWVWHIPCDDYPGTRWRWSCDPGTVPLKPYGIKAHALHPSGHAFLVSVHDHYCDRKGTFSYNTKHGRWTRLGDWCLPFGGQAHYDKRLGTLVGLHFYYHEQGFKPSGHLCSCNVPHLGRRTEPVWKSGEQLFPEDDHEQHIDVKLVFMGGGRYCLVEILTSEGVARREECIGDGDKCVLRLTTFRIEYDDAGRLTTTDRRPARSYKMSKYREYFKFQAFWV